MTAQIHFQACLIIAQTYMMYACLISVGDMQGTTDRHPTGFFQAVVCGLSFYGNLGFHDSYM